MNSIVKSPILLTLPNLTECLVLGFITFLDYFKFNHTLNRNNLRQQLHQKCDDRPTTASRFMCRTKEVEWAEWNRYRTRNKNWWNSHATVAHTVVFLVDLKTRRYLHIIGVQERFIMLLKNSQRQECVQYFEKELFQVSGTKNIVCVCEYI